MENKNNIEEAFKSKFKNFEPKVNPQLWASISSSINVGTQAAVKTGLSLVAKSIIVGSAAALIGVSVWYFAPNNNEIKNTIQQGVGQLEKENNKTPENIINQTSQTQPITEVNNNVNQSEVKIEKNKIVNQQVEPKNIVKTEDNKNDEIVIENKDTPTTDFNSDKNELNEVVEITTKIGTNDIENSADTKVSAEKEIVLPYGDIKINSNLENDFTKGFEIVNGDYDKLVWNFGDGKTSDLEKTDHIYDQLGFYNVKLELYKNNEKVVKEYQIKVHISSKISKIPNTFTPGNDGKNDEFFIKSEHLKTFNIVIYDTKNNTKVFESIDSDFKWNGFDMKGEKVSRGKYFYQIQAVGLDDKLHSKQGLITIN